MISMSFESMLAYADVIEMRTVDMHKMPMTADDRAMVVDIVSNDLFPIEICRWLHMDSIAVVVILAKVH